MLICFPLCYSQTPISVLFLLNLSVDMNHAAAPTPTFCSPSLLPPLTLSPSSLHLCQAQGSRQPPPLLFAVLGARLGPHTGCKHGPHASLFFSNSQDKSVFCREQKWLLARFCHHSNLGASCRSSLPLAERIKKIKCFFFFLPHYGGTFWGKLGFDSANFGSYCGIDVGF